VEDLVQWQLGILMELMRGIFPLLMSAVCEAVGCQKKKTGLPNSEKLRKREGFIRCQIWLKFKGHGGWLGTVAFATSSDSEGRGFEFCYRKMWSFYPGGELSSHPTQ
jgi:hypothetical protein